MWIGLSTPAKIVTLASQRTCKNSTFNHSLEWKNNQNNYNFTEELSDSQFCRLKTERKKFRLILFLSNIENPLYRTMQLQWPSFLVHENNLIQLIKSPKSLYMRLFLKWLLWLMHTHTQSHKTLPDLVLTIHSHLKLWAVRFQVCLIIPKRASTNNGSGPNLKKIIKYSI